MDYLAYFFAGAFLFNSLPHLVSGLQGRPFPTPFGKPPTVGESSPTVNFLWGLGNLVAGAALVLGFPFAPGANAPTAVFLAGAVALGVYLARHFGKVQAAKAGRRG